jgi:hypothetical protein
MTRGVLSAFPDGHALCCDSMQLFMRNLVLPFLSCLILAPAVLAQEADLAVVSAQLSKTTVVTGERFTIISQVRNGGPNTARDVLVSFGSNLGLFPISIAAPDGWTCQRNMSVPNSASCTTPIFRANATADFQVVVLAPVNTGSGPVTAHVLTSSSTPDDRASNNNRLIPFTLNEASTAADLLVALTPRETPLQPGEQGTVDVYVTNNGPSPASDVFVAIDSSAVTPLALVGVAANWVCTPTAQPSTLCRTTSTIPAGGTSTFALRFRAPDQEGGAAIFARVQAEENRDQNVNNNFVFTNVAVGTTENWRRILLPVTATNIPGANGSLWKSDITALIRSQSQITVTPGPCDHIIVLCPGLPLNTPFDAADLINDLTAPGGQFVYVRDVDEDKIRFNARVYDLSRATETAGAEIPIVREDELTTSTITLLGVATAPQYRHTLRVYEADAREGARVLIRIWANNETVPRLTTIRTLELSPINSRVTPALLPTHPGYLQLDLRQLVNLPGRDLMRIEVEPLDPGMRIWAFVSTTNNDTHHVTTVSPQ